MNKETPRISRPFHEDSAWDRVYSPWIKLTAGAVAVTALVSTVAFGVERQDPISNFKNTFAAEGECLSGTPFDPNDPEGNTRIIVDDSKGYDALIVLPQAPNYTKPSVLVFGVSEGEGFLAPPEFRQTDAVTGIYVSGLDGCPALPPY